MPTAIMRIEKRKTAALRGMAAHNGRTADTPNADPAKAHRNQHFGVAPGRMQATIQQRIEAIEERQGRKVRKDATVALELLFTTSPDWSGPSKQLAARAIEWAAKTFGKANVIGGSFHGDEKTDHVHLVVFPETPDGRLAAKHWIGSPAKLRELQDSYHAAVADLGLARGVRGSKAKHKDMAQMYAELPAQIAAGKKRLAAVSEQCADGEKRLAELRAEWAKYQKSMADWPSARVGLLQANAELESAQTLIQQQQAQLAQLRQQIAQLKADNTQLLARIQRPNQGAQLR